MARYAISRWNRLGLGAAIVVAGAALFIARPGIALAHHVTLTETGDCAAWDVKAEYIGGDGDRKIVIDVTINGEHISSTFFFDAAHSSRTAYALLFERSGSGSLHTSGTVTMYELVGGSYASTVSTATLNTNLVCAQASTPTVTSTATALPATSTPTFTATVVEESTSTPLPTRTPTATATSIDESDITPLATATATPTTTSSSATPAATNTAETTGSLSTPLPQSTPTLVSIVRGSTHPEAPVEPSSPVDRSLPATGQGSLKAGAILAGLLGTAIAAIGLAVCATGLRARERA